MNLVEKALYKWIIIIIITHFKPTETFQYTHFSSCHLQGVKKGFIKGEALKDFSEQIFEEKITNFKSHLLQTQRISSTQPSKRLITSPSTKTKEKPTNLAFCHTIPAISA